MFADRRHHAAFTPQILEEIANAVYDGTVFEIVQSLGEIQSETEKLLFRERLELQKLLREDTISGASPDRKEVEARHKEELRRFDMKAVSQLDQKVLWAGIF